MTRALVVLCALAGLTGCVSQAYAEEMLAMGAGTAACAKINADVSPGMGWANDMMTMTLLSWMQGFVSGSNANALNDGIHKNYYNLGTISRDEQWGYVIDFCRRNPNKIFAQAVLDLMAKRLEVLPVPPEHQ